MLVTRTCVREKELRAVLTLSPPGTRAGLTPPQDSQLGLFSGLALSEGAKAIRERAAAPQSRAELTCDEQEASCMLSVICLMMPLPKGDSNLDVSEED